MRSEYPHCANIQNGNNCKTYKKSDWAGYFHKGSVTNSMSMASRSFAVYRVNGRDF
jgi:hypothetical protein